MAAAQAGATERRHAAPTTGWRERRVAEALFGRGGALHQLCMPNNNLHIRRRRSHGPRAPELLTHFTPLTRPPTTLVGVWGEFVSACVRWGLVLVLLELVLNHSFPFGSPRTKHWYSDFLSSPPRPSDAVGMSASSVSSTPTSDETFSSHF